MIVSNLPQVYPSLLPCQAIFVAQPEWTREIAHPEAETSFPGKLPYCYYIDVQ